MKRFAFVFLLLLAACGREGVTQAHWDMAYSLCNSNQGVERITKPTSSPEYQYCGYRCTTSTGRTMYEMNVECKNGAKFDYSFAK